MSDSIQIPQDVPRVRANLVPMSIQHSGSANTHTFFTPSRTCELYGDKQVDAVYFRGNRLLGKDSSLGNYTGYVVNTSESLATENDGEIKTVRTLTPVASFDHISIYGHDTLPESDNQWSLLHEWSEISGIIHDDQ